MQNFFREWYDNWRAIYQEGLWRWKDYDQKSCTGWDQFPLCLMLDINKDDDPWYRPDVKWHFIENPRWNWIAGYKPWIEKIDEDDIVIQSYSSDKFKAQLDHENPR